MARDGSVLKVDTKALLTKAGHPPQGEIEKEVEEAVFLFLGWASCVYERCQERDPADIWGR